MIMKKNFKIGNKDIGEDFKTFIVAEMSGNHSGKLKNALKIVRMAKKCGADAIKLQTYKPNTITLNSNQKDFKIPKNHPGLNIKIYGIYIKMHILLGNGIKKYLRRQKKINYLFSQALSMKRL